MKKRLITLLTMSISVSLMFTACQPDKPEFEKEFLSVHMDRMYCREGGNDCAFFDGHHVYKYDYETGQQQDHFEPAVRQMLNTFYRDATQKNVKRFFEQENWQTLFPTTSLNPIIMEEIADANYATIIVPGDSSIMFVHKQEGGMGAENLIYAFQRTNVKYQVSDTLIP